MPCNRTTRPPICRKQNPPCLECRISEKEQEHERLLLLRGIAGAILDDSLQEKEAAKRTLAGKMAEAAAFKAARDQRDRKPPTREPPK